jgi:hypothetical protein
VLASSSEIVEMKENLGRRAREAICDARIRGRLQVLVRLPKKLRRMKKVAHLMDLSGNSCGEEQRLAGDVLSIGEAVDDFDNFGAESLLEETVGLVEDESAARGELGLEIRVLEVVQNPAGSSDEDVATPARENNELATRDGRDKSTHCLLSRFVSEFIFVPPTTCARKQSR